MVDYLQLFEDKFNQEYSKKYGTMKKHIIRIHDYILHDNPEQNIKRLDKSIKNLYVYATMWHIYKENQDYSRCLRLKMI